MSKLVNLKKVINFKEHAPMCLTCKHYDKAKLLMVNKQPRYSNAKCLKGDFSTENTSVCDLHENKPTVF